MVAPLVGLAIGAVARAAAKKAATTAGKKVVSSAAKKAAKEKAIIKKMQSSMPKAQKKAEKIVAKASGAAAKKTKNGKIATPKSNVTVKKANPYTADNLDKIRTVEGTRRAVDAAKKTEQIRQAKSAQRILELKKGKK
jgi:esterase/lipase